jgi:hypothetical protein
MPHDNTQYVGAWPGYAAGSTDDTAPTPREAQQHPDVAVLIDRLNVALEERDHWHAEARREHDLVEAADTERKRLHMEKAWALAQTEKMQRERDEARAVARRLYAHNRELTRDMLTLAPPTNVAREVYDRTVAQRNAAIHKAESLLRERDAAYAELAEVTATLKPVVDGCTRSTGTMSGSPSTCEDCGVCVVCGRTTHKGVCPYGCGFQLPPPSEQP